MLEPWDIHPQEWKSQGVQCFYDGHFVSWGDTKIEVSDRIKSTYINPLTLVNFLEDSWNDLQCFIKYLDKRGTSATEKEIIQHFGCKKSLAKKALSLGLDLDALAKVEGKFQVSFANSQQSTVSSQQSLARNSAKPGTYIIDQEKSLAIIKDNLGFGFVVDWLGFSLVPNLPYGKSVVYNWERDDQKIEEMALAPQELVAKFIEHEKFSINQDDIKLCLHQDTSSQEHLAIQKAQLRQDTNQSGQLKTTPMPQQSIVSDSLQLDSSSKISNSLQTHLFSASQYQISQFSLHLVQIFPWLVSEMGLLEFAEACFLKDSDVFASNAHPHLSLRTLADSLAQTKELPSLKSSKRLLAWGIAAPGNLKMETGMFLKTENGFSSWAITADVRATQPKPERRTLSDIIGEGNAIVYRAADGDRIYTTQAPCLRSLAKTGENHQSGVGCYKVREAQGESYLERSINATEAEQLMGWEVGSTATGINKEGDEIALSQTQRIKILGNGIVPGEIADILTAIKPLLESKLEKEVPEKLRFAYRQIRQKGMSHHQAIKILQQ